ncbi:hypothetical protein GLU60_01200 [Nanohaloarchaea archaeon H01]|nr:hypothetical protein [Nanohaloarchaea archaeon H01]
MKSKITVLGLLTLSMILLSHTAAASHQNHNLSFFNQSKIDLVDISHETPKNSEWVQRYEPENYDFLTLSTDIGNSSYIWIDVFLTPQQSYVNYTSSYTSENSYRTNKQADSYTECYESSPSKKKEQENNKEGETAEKAKTEDNNSEECEEQEVVVRSDYSKNLEEDMIEIEEGLNRTAMKKSQQKDLKYGYEDFVEFDKDIYIENGTSEDKVRFKVGTSVNGQTFTKGIDTDSSYFHK